MGLRIVRGLETDSLDYHVLANAVTSIKNIPGAVCGVKELGVKVAHLQTKCVFGTQTTGAKIWCLGQGQKAFITGTQQPE